MQVTTNLNDHSTQWDAVNAYLRQLVCTGRGRRAAVYYFVASIIVCINMPLILHLTLLGQNISPNISPGCAHLTLRAALHRLAKFSGSTAARHTGAVALLQGVRMSAMSLARHSRKRRRS